MGAYRAGQSGIVEMERRYCPDVRHAVPVIPTCLRTLNNMGNLLAQEGQVTGSQPDVQRAVELAVDLFG